MRQINYKQWKIILDYIPENEKLQIINELIRCNNTNIYNNLIRAIDNITGNIVLIYDTFEYIKNNYSSFENNFIQEIIFIDTKIHEWNYILNIIKKRLSFDDNNNIKDKSKIFINIKRIKFKNVEFISNEKNFNYWLIWLSLIIKDITLINELSFEYCKFFEIEEFDDYIGNNDNIHINKKRKLNFNFQLDLKRENINIDNQTEDQTIENEKKYFFYNLFNILTHKNININNKIGLNYLEITNTLISDFQLSKICYWLIKHFNFPLKQLIIDQVINNDHQINLKFPNCLVKSKISNTICTIQNCRNKNSSFKLLSKISFSGNSINNQEAIDIFNYFLECKCNENDHYFHTQTLTFDLSNNFITDDFFNFILKIHFNKLSLLKNNVEINLTGNPINEDHFININNEIPKNVQIIYKYLFPINLAFDILKCNQINVFCRKRNGIHFKYNSKIDQFSGNVNLQFFRNNEDNQYKTKTQISTETLNNSVFSKAMLDDLYDSEEDEDYNDDSEEEDEEDNSNNDLESNENENEDKTDNEDEDNNKDAEIVEENDVIESLISENNMYNLKFKKSCEKWY